MVPIKISCLETGGACCRNPLKDNISLFEAFLRHTAIECGDRYHRSIESSRT